MGLKTGRISYNLKDRGRVFRGQPRNFDTVKIAAVINSGQVQEMVKNRDMHGYHGHWPRRKFGLNPQEGGVANGKSVHLESAILTTFLRAEPDGTVELECEFLDTAPGRAASREYFSKAGGFSSVIDTKNLEFFGFDYVKEPNYTKNRGYAFDGVEDGDGVILDDVAEYEKDMADLFETLDSAQTEVEALKAQLAASQQSVKDLSATVEKMADENEVFLDAIAKHSIAKPVLDSVSKLPVTVSTKGASRMIADGQRFMGADRLARIVEEPVATKGGVNQNLVNRFLR
jgi:hypothetical protein